MSQKATITIIIILVVAAGVLAAWYFIGNNAVEPSNNNTNTAASHDLPAAQTVWIVDGNFTPSVITVSVDDTVTWINKDNISRQIASDPHPAHTDLPDLISEELAEGGSYQFTFSEAGTYGYHDELNPIKKGQVIVE